MRHAWLAISLIMGITAGSAAVAGPPRIGDSHKPDGTSIWPSFSMPPVAWPATSEPSFVRTTRTTISRAWTGTKRTTRSAWESTKNALRPFDAPANSRGGAVSDDGGFWANLFSPEEPASKATTVNDFLKQPTPY